MKGQISRPGKSNSNVKNHKRKYHRVKRTIRVRISIVVSVSCLRKHKVRKLMWTEVSIENGLRYFETAALVLRILKNMLLNGWRGCKALSSRLSLSSLSPRNSLSCSRLQIQTRLLQIKMHIYQEVQILYSNFQQMHEELLRYQI